MSNNKFKVLIIEDEANICSFIQTLLETNGYQALVAQTCMMGMTMFISYNPDLVILDLGLPDRDGLDAIRSIRQKYLTPIIVLSARTTERDKIEALDLGANDYITKPYDVDEFLARVKAQLRLARMNRLAAEQARTIRRGPLTLDTVAMRAYLESEDMGLSGREFSVLLYMVKNEGKTLSAEQIYEGAWSQPMAGNASALWKCISRLKGKLAVCEGEISLMSFRNQGYMLELVKADLEK